MAGELILQTLGFVWRRLAPLDLPIAVMGGLAVAAWEHVRTTRDVDLLIGIAADQVDAVLDRLAPEARPLRSPPVLDLSGVRILQCLYEPPESFIEVRVDLMLAESDYHRLALERRTPGQLDGLDLEVFVLSCEDLILHKLIAGRLLDRADASYLLRAHRDTMDLPYLLEWTARLDCKRELAEIWEEAFAGETPPDP